MQLPKCEACRHQFSWKELIHSQWRYGLKVKQCKICKSKFVIKNSFLLYLLPFMGTTLLNDLVFKEDSRTNDFSLTSLHFLIELTTSIMIFMIISLTLPYITKLGPPKNKSDDW